APLDDGLVYVADNGDVVMLDSGGGEVSRLLLNALPDARLVVNETQQVALYAEATDIYDHAVLGDGLEGGALVVLDSALDEVLRVTLEDGEVFEGIAPFWADVNNDGSPDLVTTVSNDRVGAQIRVYGLDGEVLLATNPLGQGDLWRHALAWGAFGINRDVLVEVVTPHISGAVIFYQRQGAQLFPTVRQPLVDYTSHQSGSRNLDGALGGDFDGDGQLEL